MYTFRMIAYLIEIGMPEFKNLHSFFAIYFTYLSRCFQKAPIKLELSFLIVHIYQGFLGHKIFDSLLRCFLQYLLFTFSDPFRGQLKTTIDDFDDFFQLILMLLFCLIVKHARLTFLRL